MEGLEDTRQRNLEISEEVEASYAWEGIGADSGALRRVGEDGYDTCVEGEAAEVDTEEGGAPGDSHKCYPRGSVPGGAFEHQHQNWVVPAWQVQKANKEMACVP